MQWERTFRACRFAGFVIWTEAQFNLLRQPIPLTLSIVFWSAVILASGIFLVRSASIYQRVSASSMLLGTVMNAAVMLSNKGYMPVMGSTALTFAWWKPGVQSDHLTWLADRASWGGSSPGDLFIFAGIAFGIAVSFCEAELRKEVPNAMGRLLHGWNLAAPIRRRRARAPIRRHSA